MSILKDVEYVYAVSYIKTMENKMLTRADLETLIMSENADSAMRFLREHGWEGENSATMLKNQLQKAWSIAYEVCPEEAPIDILLYENDFHNLKTVLKAHVEGVNWQNMTLSPYITEPEMFLTAVKSGDYSDLGEHIRECCEKAYKILASTLDGQLAEIFIDKEEYNAVLNRANQEKNEFLIGWANLLIKLTDMKTAWRCAIGKKSREFTENALILPKDGLFGEINGITEYIKSRYTDADTSSIGAFEKWCDNKKLEYAKTAKSDSFGFAPIMAFLIGKNYEVQAVRIILACKENGWDEEIIRERLRDSYV